MASEDSTPSTFRQRLLAVLDYDQIPEKQRAKLLAGICKRSLSTARRMLAGERDIGNMDGRVLLWLSEGLKVSYHWLFDGKFERFDPRTARIHLVKIKLEPDDMADRIIESVASEVPGEPKYAYFPYPIPLNMAILVEQHIRMTEWEQNKNLRFMIRLANNDPKARRLLNMYSLGQMGRRQIFSMV